MWEEKGGVIKCEITCDLKTFIHRLKPAPTILPVTSREKIAKAALQKYPTLNR
ncbi:MAG: hypothetical protein ABIL40_11855 [candidate division WOR-3 bacterium]